MKFIYYLFYVLIIIFLPFNLFSKDIPIIIISASKTPQSINNVGSTIEVIGPEIIDNSQNFTLTEIIDQNTNSTNMFKTGGLGSNTGLQIRGLEKRYTSVYIDGVKMMDPSSPDGSFYLENVLVNNIDRIEILKGTQSSIYGGNAIGGVINIFTKKNYKENTKEFSITRASNNTNNLQYSINNNFKKLNFSLGLNKLFTDGISAMNDNTELDHYRNDNMVGTAQYKFNNNIILEDSFRIANTNYNFDEVLNSRSDLNNNTDNLELSNSLKVIHQLGKLKNTYSINKLVIERYTTNYDLSKNNYFGYRDSVNYFGEYNFNLDNKIIFGLDSDFESARYKVDYGENDKEHDESIISQYIDLQSRFLENLYYTLGFRNDEHSTAGSKKSGRVSIAYLLNNDEKINASFGAGVRFPSLYDYAYSYETIADKGGSLEELQSERGLSFDLGYKKLFQNLNLDFKITYFKTEQKNPILSNSRTSWVPRNSTGKNTTEGIELLTKWDSPKKKFKVNLGYTFTNSYDANTCDIEDLESYNDGECRLSNSSVATAKVRVPRNTFSMNLNYSHNENLKSNINLKYTGERRDFGNQNNNWNDVILKEYSIVNFKNYYGLSNGLRLSFGIENLFNKKYEEAYQYSSPKRTLNVGIKTIY